MTTTTFLRPAIAQSDDVVKLSTIDQIMPRKHIALVFCFRLDDVDRNAAVKNLQHGLESALADMPQFAGEIQPVEGERDEVQLYFGPHSTVLFEETHGWTGDSFDGLKAANFHMSLLPEKQLLVSAEVMKTEHGGIRAFLVRATFIPGGLLLAVQVHHSLTDAKGAEVFLKSWSKHVSAHSQGRRIDTEILGEEALGRWRLSYGSKKGKAEDFPEFRDVPQQPPISCGEESEVVPSLWRMSKGKLEELKSFVSSSAPVSKTEALAAFLACHLYRARYGLNTEAELKIHDIILYVSIDLRSRFEPPMAADYIGNASMIVPVLTTLDQAVGVGAPALSKIGSQIHRSMMAYDTIAVKKRVGFFNRQPSISAKQPSLNVYPGSNMLLTDTSELCYYSLDWGQPLGQIDCFRTVGMAISTGNSLVYPMLRDGSIEIFVRHEKNIVDALAASAGFCRFAKLM